MTRCICDTLGEHNIQFDAYFCPKCDIWLENACDDDVPCPLCSGRPTKPSEVKND